MKKTNDPSDLDSSASKHYLLNILIGLILRYHRERRSLTQEFVAEKAGCHASYLSIIENGKATLSIKILAELCKALTVTPSALFIQANMIEEDFLNSDLIRSGSVKPDNPLTVQSWLQEYIKRNPKKPE